VKASGSCHSARIGVESFFWSVADKRRGCFRTAGAELDAASGHAVAFDDFDPVFPDAAITIARPPGEVPVVFRAFVAAWMNDPSTQASPGRSSPSQSLRERAGSDQRERQTKQNSRGSVRSMTGSGTSRSSIVVSVNGAYGGEIMHDA